MSRINEFKTTTSQFENVSDALKALDDLIKEVNERKRDTEGKCESTSVYRSHVGGVKQCIDSVIENSLDSWKSLGLDLSFCQKSEKLTKDEYRCVMLFVHPVYEQIWISDSDGRNVAEEYIPFLEFDVEYIKKSRKIAIGRAVLDKKVHLPELSSAYSAIQSDLEKIKEEALRVEAINKAAFSAVDQLTDEIAKYCGEHRLDFAGTIPKTMENQGVGSSIAPKTESNDKGENDSSSSGVLASGEGDATGGDDVLEYIEDDVDVDEEITDVSDDDSSSLKNLADDSADDSDNTIGKFGKKSKKTEKKSSFGSGRTVSTTPKSPLIVPVKPSLQAQAKS